MKDYSKKEWKRIFEDSIMDEISDAVYYHRMAKIAPDYEARDIILGIAADEERHAKELMAAYEGLFGSKYKYPSQPEPVVGNYQRALADRFNEEMNAYRKYKDYYLCTGNQKLRDLLFDIMHDEAGHAMYMLYLMEKDHKSPGCHEPEYGCGQGCNQYNPGTDNYSLPE